MKLNNGELLEKYNEIWDNVTVKKRSGSEPSYNGKYPRTRIKPYEGKINLILTKYQKKVLKVCFCLSVISIDSVFRSGKHYYP